MDFQKKINDFNDGEFDAELFFGDWNTFFTVLDKRGLISQIDIENTEVQNSLLIWLYGRNRKRFHEFVVDQLSDVDIDENGTIYLDLDDRSELSNFFCEGSRNGLSKGYVEDSDYKLVIDKNAEHFESAWAKRIPGALKFLFSK